MQIATNPWNYPQSGDTEHARAMEDINKSFNRQDTLSWVGFGLGIASVSAGGFFGGKHFLGKFGGIGGAVIGAVGGAIAGNWIGTKIGHSGVENAYAALDEIEPEPLIVPQPGPAMKPVKQNHGEPVIATVYGSGEGERRAVAELVPVDNGFGVFDPGDPGLEQAIDWAEFAIDKGEVVVVREMSEGSYIAQTLEERPVGGSKGDTEGLTDFNLQINDSSVRAVINGKDSIYVSDDA